MGDETVIIFYKNKKHKSQDALV